MILLWWLSGHFYGCLWDAMAGISRSNCTLDSSERRRVSLHLCNYICLNAAYFADEVVVFGNRHALSPFMEDMFDVCPMFVFMGEIVCFYFNR